MTTAVRRRILAGVLAGLFLGPTVGAQAEDYYAAVFHACVKRENGQMRLVAPDTTCNPSEVHVRLGGADQTRTADGSAVFQVVDAAGGVLGPVVSIESGAYPVVGLKAGQVPYILYLVDGAVLGSAFVYFTSTNCAAPGFVPPTTTAFAAAGVGLRGEVYVENRGVAAGPVSFHSLAFAGQCMENVDGGITAAQAILATTLGPAPFSVH